MRGEYVRIVSREPYHYKIVCDAGLVTTNGITEKNSVFGVCVNERIKKEMKETLEEKQTI